ncbi:protein kinase [Pseudoxanthomonas gei]|uniref:non-specific serine/threonine protein kinase n=1 Tax=Pseudoxanthomonas gei TaxID=1383030 RepID=A0ABX0AGY8_9GAMM|nr:ATPase domain-containing protein [Pseudoxanthomonas gei]NDK38468.1 protein kinase [Pseudoxanthomonas gei]
MSNNAIIKRLDTGVPGLNEILGGGLPEFSFNIIAGPPGSGKTTLAHQMMFALATEEKPAIFFTVLGEPPLKMLRYQQQFAFFDKGAIGRSVHFINLSEQMQSGDLRAVLARIVEVVETHGPGLVFVDSFRAVVIASRTDAPTSMGLQQFVQELGMLMTNWQATTFLIGEYFSENEPNPVFTVSDGLIWLRQNLDRNSIVRKIEIIKMRGQASLPGQHTFRIGSAGLQIFPPAQVSVQGAELPGPPEGPPLGMGVPGLDEMMGGGLPRGYSLLVAGPSGSGKSILASQFLAEGARCGEKSVIASFEQRPRLSRNRIVADLIDSGDVGLIRAQQCDLSVDEVTALLLMEIRRLGATRVVLDSLTGFELMVAPEFADTYRQSLARMVGAVVSTGVSVLMTSELEDRYTDLRFSPYGAAFLTDAIIVQRYIEVDSRLLRVMAVVKVRAAAHSNELRQFVINDQGICIGEPMPEYRGLLGGRPERADQGDAGTRIRD